jgi:hypothetical protein
VLSKTRKHGGPAKDAENPNVFFRFP